MSHVYHEDLPDFNPEAIYHHGCPDCQAKVDAGIPGLLRLDPDRLDKLWSRMCWLEFFPMTARAALKSNPTEAQAMALCYSLYALLERAGFSTFVLRSKFSEMARNVAEGY